MNFCIVMWYDETIYSYGNITLTEKKNEKNIIFIIY